MNDDGVTLADLLSERSFLLDKEQDIRDKRKDVEARIADILGARGHVRWGDTIVRTSPADRTVECMDPVGFSEWLANQQPATLRSVFNPKYVRKTGLPEGVFDSFFDTHQSDRRQVVFLPMDRAPKYMQTVREGMAVLDGEELSVEEVR